MGGTGVEMSNHCWLLFLRAKGNGSLLLPLLPKIKPNEDGWIPFTPKGKEDALCLP